ncbi:hypothetical protein COV18_03795 [Candidatus Woesearchaeota archaeon CG10_big_fil_rev_8_21_14_0_10_37_12]|nr:MAG: hypothetical protein COV18_03795 [Candidatus Woesearchaeota archaeon CG10_big_fil_rev_8_21_14_0_10_37_12]
MLSTHDQLVQLLLPETDIERKIISDKEFMEGAFWGEPRQGHPEGQVGYHIREVLDNVEKYGFSENREQLRFLALLHDTFKHKVDITKPKMGENHHGMIARRFAEKYIKDKVVLKLLELHDEAYNAWQKGSRDGNWEVAKARAEKLLVKLRDNAQLYLIFYRCDNETGSKSQENYLWFEKFVNERKQNILGI